MEAATASSSDTPHDRRREQAVGHGGGEQRPGAAHEERQHGSGRGLAAEAANGDRHPDRHGGGRGDERRGGPAAAGQAEDLQAAEEDDHPRRVALDMDGRISEVRHVGADVGAESALADGGQGRGVVEAGAERPGEAGPARAGSEGDAPGDRGDPGYEQQLSPRAGASEERAACGYEERDHERDRDAPAESRAPVGEERRGEEGEVRTRRAAAGHPTRRRRRARVPSR